MEIKEAWSFNNENASSEFDKHVREQLPWYDLATQSAVNILDHFLPRGGLVYDIGTSTGNISKNIKKSKEAKIVRIDNSYNIVKDSVCDNLVIADAQDFKFKEFDVAVCFLVLSFMPIKERKEMVSQLIEKKKDGGAIIILDKVFINNPQISFAERRLTTLFKRKTTEDSLILDKDLSLAGIQRQLSENEFDEIGNVFFKLGEFKGWVIT